MLRQLWFFFTYICLYHYFKYINYVHTTVLTSKHFILAPDSLWKNRVYVFILAPDSIWQNVFNRPPIHRDKICFKLPPDFMWQNIFFIGSRFNVTKCVLILAYDSMWQNMFYIGSRFHVAKYVLYSLPIPGDMFWTGSRFNCDKICLILTPDFMWQNIFLYWLPIPCDKIC